MTSKQLKYGLGNTASGCMNKEKLYGKYKQIDLDDFDVQMLSTQFVPNDKTLKRPLSQGPSTKTSYRPIMLPQNDKTQKNVPQVKQTLNGKGWLIEDYTEEQMNKTKTRNTQPFSIISWEGTKAIKPAYKRQADILTQKKSANLYNGQKTQQFLELDHLSFDSQTTIFNAMRRKAMLASKGQNPKLLHPSQMIVQTKQSSNTQKEQFNVNTNNSSNSNKAQNKLKKLFNKTSSTTTAKTSNFSPTKHSNHQKNQELSEQIVQQEIQQSIIDEYIEEDFEKYSSSGIKESIMAYSGAKSRSRVRQSIGEEIKESIRASYSGGNIPEYIASYKSSGSGNKGRSSGSGIREDIAEEISGSRQRSSFNKGDEEVYEEIFEQYEQSVSKSRNAVPKSFKQSTDNLNKSFRKKTNVVKSIKFAQEINQQEHSITQEKHYKQPKGKHEKNLIEQKQNLNRMKNAINTLLNPPNKHNNNTIPSQRNKNLLYQFKIQLNKLLTSDKFQSKLKKLTAFIGEKDTNADITRVQKLESTIIENVMRQMEAFKKAHTEGQQIEQLKKYYEDKLSKELKAQEINLRVQMDQKLHQKDLQLKKMIAQLQQRFTQAGSGKMATAKFNNFMGRTQDGQNEKLDFSYDSDFSIDSDQVSWKADLWQILPDFEKNKLYQKQTREVTNFLTDLMMNELKEQALNRSLNDISFQFPPDIEMEEKLQQSSVNLKKSYMEQDTFHPKANYNTTIMNKSAFSKKDKNQMIMKPTKQQKTQTKTSIFPDFPRPKYNIQPILPPLQSTQNINQYSKQGQEPAFEPIIRRPQQKQQIIQILSKYKSLYLRKKNDIIRKILKSLKNKNSTSLPKENLLSLVQNIQILSQKDISQKDLVYVRAYQEELIWSLTSIISKNAERKASAVEEMMRAQYDRLVVLAQVSAADNASETVNIETYSHEPYNQWTKENSKLQLKSCPIEQPHRQEAVKLIQKRKQQEVKDDLVKSILDILAGQLAKQFPKKKK